MGKLIDEHIQARQMVSQLIAARDNYRIGDTKAVEAIAACLENLAKVYPAHIEKVDKHFFYPCLEYFSKLNRMPCCRNSGNLTGS